MQELTLERAKAIYRAAIDSTVPDGSDDAAWWDDVVCELGELLAAPSTAEAAKVIAWWHNDWSMIGDTPRAAAARLRAASRRRLH